ncbi:MAG: hypothetical protein NTX49_04670 [Chlamydiae bacterium]|nr:hypothetical protein [Chlamydiota bacterium]
MSTPAIASRAADAALDTAPRPDTSCCSILVKTALTVAVVAATAIAFTVTLACASPLVGLVILGVALPLTAIFLGATWAGSSSYVSYPAPRAYAPVYTSAPSPLFFGSARGIFGTERASASRFGPPAGAAFADRPLESGWGRGHAFGGMPAARAHRAVSGGFGGVVLPMGPPRAAPEAGHVGVGSGRRSR